MNRRLTSVLSWYGVVAILAAYALVSFKIIQPTTLVYLLLNLTGSLGIIFEAFRKKDTQPVVLNIAWALIALIGVVKLLVL